MAFLWYCTVVAPHVSENILGVLNRWKLENIMYLFVCLLLPIAKWWRFIQQTDAAAKGAGRLDGLGAFKEFSRCVRPPAPPLPAFTVWWPRTAGARIKRESTNAVPNVPVIRLYPSCYCFTIGGWLMTVDWWVMPLLSWGSSYPIRHTLSIRHMPYKAYLIFGISMGLFIRFCFSKSVLGWGILLVLLITVITVAKAFWSLAESAYRAVGFTSVR